MNEEELLAKYGNIFSVMCNEGDGYYFYGYESEGTFDFDKDLKSAFILANTNIELFKKLLEKRITDNGGLPEDYEV